MSGWNRNKYQRSNAPGGGDRDGAGGGTGGGGRSGGNTGGGRGGGNTGGAGSDEHSRGFPMDPDHQPKLEDGHGEANPQDDVYRFAIYPPPQNSGKDMVQTNHFLIKSIPRELFVYNVTFSFASRASESDKGQKSENHEEQEPRESEMREIRKSEKRRIFKSLRSHAPLNDPSIPWATDYENTIWSMKLFPSEEPAVVVQGLQYRQQNGRLVTLSAANLTPGGILDFDQQSPPHANLLTDANGQVKMTALNAIVARYVSERPDGVMHVVANKFYKIWAFRPMMYLDAFRGYVDSFSSLTMESD